MKKIFVFLLPALLFVLQAPAQTKRIALLSRGGKLSSMNMKSEGNFGETPEMIRKYHLNWDSAFRADSVRLADSIAKKYMKPEIDGGKSSQMMPQRRNPSGAGSWLSRTPERN